MEGRWGRVHQTKKICSFTFALEDEHDTWVGHVIACHRSLEVAEEVAQSQRVMDGGILISDRPAECASESECEVEVVKPLIAMSKEEWVSDIALPAVSFEDCNQDLSQLGDEYGNDQDWVVARNPSRPHVEVNLKTQKTYKDSQHI